MNQEPLNKDNLEKLGWHFEGKGSPPFFWDTEEYSLVNEDGFNTCTRWGLILDDPEKCPGQVHLEWEAYSSYDTSEGELKFQLEGIDDMRKLMSWMGIKTKEV